MAADASDERARVLVIFPGALGDLICLLPTLRALARRHRGTALELMAREELARLAIGRIGVARAHSIDRREIAALFAGGTLAESAAQFFRGFARIYSFFASGDERFRRALEEAAAPAAVSFHAFRPARPGHVAAAYLEEIGEYAGPDASLEARIDLLDTDATEAQQALARCGLDPARALLLFPGSGGAHKNWPLEKFVALATALPAGLRPLAVLGPAETGMAPLFATRRVAMVSGLALGAVAGLASMASGFVGNDSGVSHLAAAAGARGVAIFGPTEPGRWRPLGRVRVLRADSLDRLGVESVASALAEHIGQVEFCPAPSVSHWRAPTGAHGDGRGR
ncbi:MAG TPA: glycosyltransferase family 9 protein [Candidatus Binataceae bacterium]|nr:glycosyltransferase family 9 protein [Candidatus Binataceae bacterium]